MRIALLVMAFGVVIGWPGSAGAQTATYQQCMEACPNCHEMCMDHTQGSGSAERLEVCADRMCPTGDQNCLQTHCSDFMPIGSVPDPPSCHMVYSCALSCADNDQACLDACSAKAPMFASMGLALLKCDRENNCQNTECLWEKCPQLADNCDIYHDPELPLMLYVGGGVWAAAGAYSMSGWMAQAGIMSDAVHLQLELGMGSFDGELEEVAHEGEVTRALLRVQRGMYFKPAYFRYGAGLGLEWIHHLSERELTQDSVFARRAGATALPLRVSAGAGLIFAPITLGIEALAGQHFIVKGDLDGFFEFEVRASAGLVF